MFPSRWCRIKFSHGYEALMRRARPAEGGTKNNPARLDVFVDLLYYVCGQFPHRFVPEIPASIVMTIPEL